MSHTPTSALPPATQRVFESLSSAPGLDQFTLVGGTALSLRLSHRMSEDLDFVTTEPFQESHIIQALEHLHSLGHQRFTKVTDPSMAVELASRGASLDSYSQTWKVDGVKLQFFVKQFDAEQVAARYHSLVESAPVEGLETGAVAVASERFLFFSKAQLLAERRTSRDLYDLKALIETGRWSFEDLVEAASFLGVSPELTCEILASSEPPADDQPVVLLDGSSADPVALLDFFNCLVSAFEQGQAEKVFREGRWSLK